MPDRPPTPEEIRATCLEIQESWSDAERRQRVADDKIRRLMSGAKEITAVRTAC